MNDLSDLHDSGMALSNLGLTASSNEINYLGGISGNVQAQLDGKTFVGHAHLISSVTGLQGALDLKIGSDPSVVSGADAVSNIISMSQAEYEAIGTPGASTLYIITG